MSKYQINFSGLIAFVPHTNSQEVMVLLANGAFRHRDSSNEELFPHFPFILYNLKDLSEESPRRPELTGRGFGLNFLNLEELTIGSQPKKPDLQFLLSNDDRPGLQSVEPREEPRLEALGHANGNGRFRDAEDLRWIMPIDKIGLIDGVSPEQLRIDEKLLVKEYKADPQEERLAARLKLRTGRLFTRDFQRAGMAGERLNTVCNFFDEKAPARKTHFSQAISTLVTYEPPNKGTDPLKISSRRFPLLNSNGFKNGIFPDLVFRTPDEVGRDIVANIWNAPMADILDLLGGTDKHSWDRPEGNRSFRSFFRLCETPPTKLPALEKSRAIAAQVQSIAGPAKDVGCPTCKFPAATYS